MLTTLQLPAPTQPPCSTQLSIIIVYSHHKASTQRAAVTSDISVGQAFQKVLRTRLAMVAHSSNPRAQETEVGGLM